MLGIKRRETPRPGRTCRSRRTRASPRSNIRHAPTCSQAAAPRACRAIPDLVVEPLGARYPCACYRRQVRSDRQGLHPHRNGSGDQPVLPGEDGRRHPGPGGVYPARRPHPLPHRSGRAADGHRGGRRALRRPIRRTRRAIPSSPRTQPIPEGTVRTGIANPKPFRAYASKSPRRGFDEVPDRLRALMGRVSPPRRSRFPQPATKCRIHRAEVHRLYRPAPVPP
jgi:hypothetical protein